MVIKTIAKTVYRSVKKNEAKKVEGIEELFSTWKPREKYEFLKDTDFEKRVLPHKLIY